MTWAPVFPLLALACLGAGCGLAETPTSPTTTAEATPPRTVLFSGSLAVGASRFYSFTAVSAGSVSVMLASVASSPGGVPLPTRLGVGVGVPSGTGCALMQSVSTQSGLTAQLQHPVDPGVHCVSVFDEGAMTAAVDFAIRFSHP